MDFQFNRNVSYTPPAQREIMPFGTLLGYAKEHWVPYACHMLCISMLAKIAGPFYAYPVAVVSTAIALLYFGMQGNYPELRVRGTTVVDWLLALGVGVIGIVLWIAPYHYISEIMFARIPILGNRNIYLSFTYGADIAEDAWRAVANGLVLLPTALPQSTYNVPELSGLWKQVFLAFRICGAVITVPFFEELFTRSLVIRFVEDEYYKRVPIGWFTRKSALIALGIFVFSHPWWLVAIIWGVLIMWLLYTTRNLLVCVAAHAVSNFLLALYILKTGNYYLW
jgi:CAAX prenyl protease-like protein